MQTEDHAKKEYDPAIGHSGHSYSDSGQYIIIKGIWKQKDEMLYFRYRTISQEVISNLHNQRINPYDTVSFILSMYTESLVKELPGIRDEQKIKAKNAEILGIFQEY